MHGKSGCKRQRWRGSEFSVISVSICKTSGLCYHLCMYLCSGAFCEFYRSTPLLDIEDLYDFGARLQELLKRAERGRHGLILYVLLVKECICICSIACFRQYKHVHVLSNVCILSIIRSAKVWLLADRPQDSRTGQAACGTLCACSNEGGRGGGAGWSGTLVFLASWQVCSN